MNPDRPSRLEQTWLIVVLIMASACVAQAFGRFTWGVVLPGARDDLLSGSNSMAGLFGTLNVTFYLGGTLAVSWAASRFTLVWLIRVGLVLSTTALGIAAVAPNGLVLGLALSLMGFGGAVIWIPSPAIVARALPPARGGMAAGLVGSGIGIGIVFAGQSASALGRSRPSEDVWQTMYRIEFGVALVVLAGTFFLLRSQGDRPSVAGGFGGFAALRKVDGWLPLTVAYASFGFAYILVLGYLVARLEDDAGFSTDRATAMFSLLGVSAAIGGVLLGPLSDRIGRRLTLSVAFTLFGLFGLLLLTGKQPWVAVAAVGLGLMFSGMPALIIAQIVDATDHDSYGPVFSAATLSFGLAQMVSPQIGGLIASAAGSFTWVFVLSASVSFVGAAAASRLPAGPSSRPVPTGSSGG